jgi:putative peptidoglycan lipid II flippase
MKSGHARPQDGHLTTRVLTDPGSGAGPVPEQPTESAPTQQTVAAGRQRLALNTAIVGGAFVLSRVLGLVREAVIAGQFGTTEQKDAYVAAFRVPDTLFLLIIGGAVGSAFIPVFTGLMGKGEENKAWNLTSTLINASVVLLSLGGIIMGFAAPALVGAVVAPGLTPQQEALTVELLRILLLSPLFMGLGGWAMGILNARQHFALPALAPIFYNLAIIAGAVFLAPFLGIHGVAIGVVAGALLHFGVQVPGLRRVGMRYRLRLNVRDTGAAEVGKLLLPRIVGQAAFQANIVAMTSIASFLPRGSISALDYSYMLMILPHGVFAMSLATVTFPTMAAQYAEGNLDGVRRTLARAVKVLLFLTIPSAVGLFLLRFEIVASLFRFGLFGEESTALVADSLGFFALGLVAYAVVEVLTRGFYALHDTATPVAVSVGTVLLNLGISLALVVGVGWRSHEALALSLAITTTVEMELMWVLLGRKLPGWALRREGLLASISKSALAAAAMGIVLFGLLYLLHALLPGSSTDKMEAIALVVVGIGVGGLVYLLVAKAVRSEEVEEATDLLLRRIRRGKRA